MRALRVLMPNSEFESWTLLGDDHMPVEPVEWFLAHLASIEKSPNTIKAYAHDLKDWFTYLDTHGQPAVRDAGALNRLTQKHYGYATPDERLKELTGAFTP